ncbi:MAG: hypothetical protein ACKN9D_07755 [Actinomycetales bacterium]
MLIAKVHKIHDRISTPDRLNSKDAHDVYRLLRAIDTEILATVLGRLLHHPFSSEVTGEALAHLREDFAHGPSANGSVMAGSAERLVGDPVAVAESVTLLARDLLDALHLSPG